MWHHSLTVEQVATSIEYGMELLQDGTPAISLTPTPSTMTPAASATHLPSVASHAGSCTPARNSRAMAPSCVATPESSFQAKCFDAEPLVPQALRFTPKAVAQALGSSGVETDADDGQPWLDMPVERQGSSTGLLLPVPPFAHVVSACAATATVASCGAASASSLVGWGAQAHTPASASPPQPPSQVVSLRLALDAVGPGQASVGQHDIQDEEDVDGVDGEVTSRVWAHSCGSHSQQTSTGSSGASSDDDGGSGDVDVPMLASPCMSPAHEEPTEAAYVQVALFPHFTLPVGRRRRTDCSWGSGSPDTLHLTPRLPCEAPPQLETPMSGSPSLSAASAAATTNDPLKLSPAGPEGYTADDAVERSVVGGAPQPPQLGGAKPVPDATSYSLIGQLPGYTIIPSLPRNLSLAPCPVHVLVHDLMDLLTQDQAGLGQLCAAASAPGARLVVSTRAGHHDAMAALVAAHESAVARGGPFLPEPAALITSAGTKVRYTFGLCWVSFCDHVAGKG